MAMSVLMVLMMAVSLVYAGLNGRLDTVSAALFAGADTAVELVISMTGVICLWCAVVEVMRRAGLMERLAALLARPLVFLFPEAANDSALRGELAACVSANLLGLGNAATPLSIRACTRLHAHSRRTGVASDSVCMLIVLCAGSLQLIPSTIAALRASQGAANPFDILPAVWLATAASCATGILLARLFARVWGTAS